jgi:hypothetical protein
VNIRDNGDKLKNTRFTQFLLLHCVYKYSNESKYECVCVYRSAYKCIKAKIIQEHSRFKNNVYVFLFPCVTKIKTTTLPLCQLFIFSKLFPLYLLLVTLYKQKITFMMLNRVNKKLRIEINAFYILYNIYMAILIICHFIS